MQRQIFETEHNLFRDAFRAFLDKEVVPHQDAWEEAGVVDRAVWRKAGEMGFLLPWADEEYGGAGLKDFRYEQIMCEELARINEPGFMIPLHSALCGPYIAEYGSAEQKARLLPGIVRGETILAVAMTEPSAGSDLAGMRSTAVDKGDHWLLNGSKVFISNGLLADLVIVAAKTDPANKHAMGLFLVERGMQGFERGRNLKKLGMKSQDTAELFFNNVRVPKENLLGDAKGGFFYLMNMLAQERLTNACGAVAGAEAALQATIDYVKGRPFAPSAEQWDQAVACWQGLVSDADARFDTVVELDAAQIKPQVSWGTSPEMVLAVDQNVPDPARESDPIKRGSIERALKYMGLRPNQAITDIQLDRVFIGS
ncbi:MAG: acyl-CoA dehydrogenase family protein, partial [Pseudomonas aeruginosa]|nr:acyl-CoA dehydrogenase family protein [Pseudomonas aeruginosa]